jgi:hypothetical protein
VGSKLDVDSSTFTRRSTARAARWKTGSCQLDLYGDRTSIDAMRANQLRLWFAMAYLLLDPIRLASATIRRIGSATSEEKTAEEIMGARQYRKASRTGNRHLLTRPLSKERIDWKLFGPCFPSGA